MTDVNHVLDIIINYHEDKKDYKDLGWNRAVSTIFDRICNFGLTDLKQYIDLLLSTYYDLMKIAARSTRVDYYIGATGACRQIKHRLMREHII